MLWVPGLFDGGWRFSRLKYLSVSKAQLTLVILPPKSFTIYLLIFIIALPVESKQVAEGKEQVLIVLFVFDELTDDPRTPNCAV